MRWLFWVCLLGLWLARAEDAEESSAANAGALATEKETRLWGSNGINNKAEAAVPGGSINASGNSNANGSGTTTSTSGSDNISHGTSKVPFVPNKPPASATTSSFGIHHEPPEGFQITSRVYTDPEDKLAHFDNDSVLVFPYSECGVAGSTTVPIPLRHATVRHLLGGSQPNLYSGDEFGPYPQLVVALSSLEIVLNSGQSQIFQPGDVILLENVVSGGHKLKGHDQQSMSVMILTLTQHYHQVGKDKTSLQSILAKNVKISPCSTTDGLEFSVPPEMEDERDLGNKVGRVLRKLQQPRSIRRYILTVFGLSLSTLLGDFMGKAAPLWLAVVFGGGCFVTGGTLAFVTIGDKALDELEMWRERRQLRLELPAKEDENEEVDVEAVIDAAANGLDKDASPRIRTPNNDPAPA